MPAAPDADPLSPPPGVAATIESWARGAPPGTGVLGWWVRLAGTERSWHLAVPDSAPEFSLTADAPPIGKVDNPPRAACGLAVDSFSFQWFSNRDIGNPAIGQLCQGCSAELPGLAAGYSRDLVAGANELAALHAQLADDPGAVWLRAARHAQLVASRRHGGAWDPTSAAAFDWLVGAYDQIARQAAEATSDPAAAASAETDAFARCLAVSFDEILVAEAGSTATSQRTLASALKDEGWRFVDAAAAGADLDVLERDALRQLAAARTNPRPVELLDWAAGRTARPPQLASEDFADLRSYLEAEWAHWYAALAGRVFGAARRAAETLSRHRAAGSAAVSVSLEELGVEGVELLGRMTAPFAPQLRRDELHAEVPPLVALACRVEMGDAVTVSGSATLETCLSLYGADVALLSDALDAAAALCAPGVPPAR